MNRYDIIQKRKQDVGRRIRLVNIADAENDPQMRRLIGQTGTIVKVDDSGSYQVDWDNSGSRLSVLIEDTVEFLDEITESRADSFRRNFKSFKNSLNESFNNQELTDAVKDHDGLVTLRGKHNFIGSSDARQNEVSYDLQDAEFRGYIPEDAMEYIYMLDFYKPLNRQLMFCNDGGAIIIEHYPSYSSTGDTPYEAKMRVRNDKFRNEHGYGRYPYTGIDTDAAKYRRRQNNGNLSFDEKLYMKDK